jgi:lactate dehydrogenase-like 2-hydroxyacid dehydrogenase
VSRSRVGILGLGRIGRTIARRLEGFDCAISYHSRTPVAGVLYEYAASPLELATRVDSLVVAVPGGPATDRLVGHDVLQALGPAGVLVNVARGSVVDEGALVAALERGHLAGVALDTFRTEPQVPTALVDRDDVVLLPHVGSGTEETRRAMDDLVLGNLAAWFAERTLLTPVPHAVEPQGAGRAAE